MRLVKAGRLLRVGRGLYDMPRFSKVLKRAAPVDLEAAIAAPARRDGIRIMPDGLVAANHLDLTNAVPATVRMAWWLPIIWISRMRCPRRSAL